MIDQYNHRLLSLEVELQEASRMNQIGVHDYERRARVIAELRRDLTEISELNNLESTDPFDADDADLGLPVTGNCTPAEIAVCSDFLDQKQIFMRRAERDTRRVLGWVREAISESKGGSGLGSGGGSGGGTGGWAAGGWGWRMTWRLSRLRRMIHQTEARTKLLNQESAVVDQYIDRLVRGLGKSMPTKGKGVFARGKTQHQGALRGTIDGLMQVFSDLDGVISRVAKLRATVKNERHRIAQMLSWLESHEREVFSSRPVMAPPSPMATARALAEIPAVPGLELDADRRRLGLAKGFLKKMVRQSSTTAAPKEQPGRPEVVSENQLASGVDPEFDPESILRAIAKGRTAREIRGII